MPRVRYKPWTFYEEMVGLKNARTISRCLLAVVFSTTVMQILLYTKYGRSRHVSGDPEANAALNEEYEDRLDRLLVKPPKSDDVDKTLSLQNRYRSDRPLQAKEAR